MTYNKRIAIEKHVVTADIIGNQKEVWENVLNTYADIRHSGGKEYYSAAQVNSQNDFIFRIRYSKTIENMPFKTADYRIIYKNNVFNVKSVENYLEKNQEFVIHGEAVS